MGIVKSEPLTLTVGPRIYEDGKLGILLHESITDLLEFEEGNSLEITVRKVSRDVS